MTVNDLANVGVFVIALVGYVLGTGFFGVITSNGDEDMMPIASWIWGAITYAITVMIMWKG